MRLDFNVLWVEDQQERVDAQCQKIERGMWREGFRFRVEFAKSVEEGLMLIGDDIYSDHVDLILMDYDLGEGMKGDEGLLEIRSKLPYRELVFYSSQAADLLRLVSEAKIEGVYCSTREDLPDRVLGVFDTLVRKVLDIDHARGLVMGATSDIDHLVNEALGYAFEACSVAEQEKALELVNKRLEDIRQRFDESFKAVQGVKHVSELRDHHATYTAVDRLQLLRKVLKLLKVHTDKDRGLADYADKVMPKRNVLGHVRVHRDGFKRQLIDHKGKEHTSEEMRELRLQLLSHEAALEELSNALRDSLTKKEAS